MSLCDPPHLDPRTYVACTCGATELRHDDSCATQDPEHPSWERAMEVVERNERYWHGKKRRG